MTCYECLLYKHMNVGRLLIWLDGPAIQDAELSGCLVLPAIIREYSTHTICGSRAVVLYVCNMLYMLCRESCFILLQLYKFTRVLWYSYECNGCTGTVLVQYTRPDIPDYNELLISVFFCDVLVITREVW